MRIRRLPLAAIRLVAPLFLAALTVIPSLGQEIRILENGQPTPVGTDIGAYLDTPSRTKIDLAGVWSYTIDEETWRDAKVPGSFDYEGRVIFQRTFEVSEPMLAASAFQLVALGVNYEAEAFVNDIFVGKHTGGYTSFQFDIPENVIQSGEENVVRIVVSNQLSARTTLPLRKQIWGWKNYGGIHRDIFLLVTPRLWVESLQARSILSEDGRSATVHAKAVVSNRGFTPLIGSDTLKTKPPIYQMIFEVLDAFSGGLITQAAPYGMNIENGKDADVDVVFPVYSPRLWSPENPNLYNIRATIVSVEGRKQATVDEARIDFGFVKVTIGKGGFHVNGRRVHLKGITWNEDDPRYGVSLPYDRMEKDFALIRTLGANAVRFAFHPPHPYVVNLCNRYGLFALIEIPVWNVPGEILGDEMFQSLAEASARETIRRDRNNPSVIAWGLGDDFDSSDPRAHRFVERTVAVMKALDERPVFYGSRMIGKDHGADLVDFVGINIGEMPLQEFKTSLASVKQSHPDRPVVVLRYGKTVESGNRNGYSDPMSEEAQARFFLQHFTAIREASIAGSFIGSFADWRGDRPILTVDQKDPYLHPIGLLTHDREKRLAFEVVKTLYAGQKVAALPIGKHRTSFPAVHVVSGFLVIFLVAYQYHYNRRFNESFKRSILRSYNFFADLRDVRTVSVFHTLLLMAMIALTLAVVMSSLLYHFKTDVMADYLLSQLLVWDLAKEFVIHATWNPLEGILGFTGVFLVLIFLVSFLVRVSSLFIRSKIHWTHAFSLTVWASVPLVFLSPLGMSLFKILQTPFYVLPSLLILAVFLLWVVLRMLKGISVVFDLSPVKTYIGGSLAAGGLIALVVFYYDSQFSLIAYLEFLYHMTRSLS
ncbi:MAG: beta galactosidase jelly roll domain-containing protein [Ignavibacteriales bacterium]|nr:beta galactosidase jelly roll domain-containing protein [Ignavibacteriales bacterium]